MAALRCSRGLTCHGAGCSPLLSVGLGQGPYSQRSAAWPWSSPKAWPRPAPVLLPPHSWSAPARARVCPCSTLGPPRPPPSLPLPYSGPAPGRDARPGRAQP